MVAKVFKCGLLNYLLKLIGTFKWEVWKTIRINIAKLKLGIISRILVVGKMQVFFMFGMAESLILFLGIYFSHRIHINTSTVYAEVHTPR